MRFQPQHKFALMSLYLSLAFLTPNVSHAGVQAQEFPERGQFILRCIEEYLYFSGFGLERPFTFEGDVYIPGDQPIVANEVRLAANTRLIFTSTAGSTRKQRYSSQCGEAIYIITDSLLLDGEATLSWEHEEIPNEPFDRGIAPSGASGAAFGQSGRAGATGAPGNPGFVGRDAPTLFLVARTVQGGSLTIDFSGQNGGVGGKGQTGGNGGNGRTGRSASQSLFDCKRGPGRGGDGGDGGQGGVGGKGGDGGLGGTVIALLPISLNPAEHLDVEVGGGGEGAGGEFGEGGNAGRGGSEGKAKTPYCRSAGRSGSDGENGTVGNQGSAGESGPDGDLFVLPLTDEEFQKLLSSRRG